MRCAAGPGILLSLAGDADADAAAVGREAGEAPEAETATSGTDRAGGSSEEPGASSSRHLSGEHAVVVEIHVHVSSPSASTGTVPQQQPHAFIQPPLFIRGEQPGLVRSLGQGRRR